MPGRASEAPEHEQRSNDASTAEETIDPGDANATKRTQGPKTTKKQQGPKTASVATAAANRNLFFFASDVFATRAGLKEERVRIAIQETKRSAKDPNRH